MGSEDGEMEGGSRRQGTEAFGELGGEAAYKQPGFHKGNGIIGVRLEMELGAREAIQGLAGFPEQQMVSRAGAEIR